MSEQTYYTPFIKDGEVVTESITRPELPESDFTIYRKVGLSGDQKLLAHIAPTEELVELYAPGEEDPYDCITYTTQAELDAKLLEVAKENSVVQSNAV